MIDPVLSDLNRHLREIERMASLEEELEAQKAENALLVDRINVLLKRLQDDVPRQYEAVEKAKCDSNKGLPWRC